VTTPRLFFAAAVLAVAATACSADPPAGTIAEDDLPGEPEVADVRTKDTQAGQVLCPDVNDAEDNHLMTPSENFDRDRRAAVAYGLAGPNHEEVSDSVWRISDPEEAVAQVAAGLEKCVAAYPEVYRTFSVDGHPEALGYVEEGGDPVSVTRRILVPLSDRVVVVTTTRQGGDDFTVLPEDVLEKAIEVSADAPHD
jgi:hypothetical protein